MSPAVTPLLLLASASPRRSALLAQLGIAHAIAAADVDETPLPGEPPEALVVRLASLKALRGSSSGALPVLGADTVVCVDGHILGKPRDADDAAGMLRRLSGRAHRVLSGVALAMRGTTRTALCSSTVTFRS